MLTWLLAAALGAAIAVFTYGAARPASRRFLLLRALAATVVVALLLDAPLAPPRPLASWVALDVSASLAASPARWAAARAAADSAMAAGGDSLFVFGDALRPLPRAPEQATDVASRIGALVDAARVQGRPVVVITDGRLDDPERVAELPRGSQLLIPQGAESPDLGLAPLGHAAAAVIGDTVEVTVLVRANAAPTAGPRTLTLTLGGRTLATVPVTDLPPDGERELRLPLVIPAVEGEQALVAALDATDGFAANDSAQGTLQVQGAASIAVVSTAPDQDARFALAMLRQTQRGAVRGYWRVAPGQWREGDALRPVAEDVVRRAVAGASLLVLHGDTAYFGSARARTGAAVVLMPSVPPSEEYYVTAAGDSPLRAALAELPVADLPPLRVGAAAPGLSALLARRARRTDERAVVSLREGASRSVVVTASGFWRWRTRGGRPAEAFDAMWGSIFDWATGAAMPTRRADAGSARTQELVPRPASVAPGPVGTAPVRDLAPRARGAWWLAALALLAFSAEWMLRRRIGWR